MTKTNLPPISPTEEQSPPDPDECARYEAFSNLHLELSLSGDSLVWKATGKPATTKHISVAYARSEIRTQLRESQTREAQKDALNGKLRDALEHALVPVAALVVSGECVDAPSALEEGLKVAILTAHDEMLAVLSLTPSQALQWLKAQVLRDAREKLANLPTGFQYDSVAYWLREQATEAEGKGAGDEPQS